MSQSVSTEQFGFSWLGVSNLEVIVIPDVRDTNNEHAHPATGSMNEAGSVSVWKSSAPPTRADPVIARPESSDPRIRAASSNAGGACGRRYSPFGRPGNEIVRRWPVRGRRGTSDRIPPALPVGPVAEGALQLSCSLVVATAQHQSPRGKADADRVFDNLVDRLGIEVGRKVRRTDPMGDFS